MKQISRGVGFSFYGCQSLILYSTNFPAGHLRQAVIVPNQELTSPPPAALLPQGPRAASLPSMLCPCG